MKRGDFTITDPVMQSGFTLPNGPVLEAGSRSKFTHAGRRACLFGHSTEPGVKGRLYPEFEFVITTTPAAREVQQLRTGMRRILENGAIEQCMAMLELPGAVWQWNAPDPGHTITVDAVIKVVGDALWEWNHTARTLAIRGSNEHTLVAAFNRDVEWQVAAADDAQSLKILVKIESISDGEILFGIVAGKNTADLARTTARLEKPQLLASARRTATLQQDTQQPFVDTPDAAVNAALRWSAHLANNALVDADHGRKAVPGYNAAAIALTLLALGDATSARGVLANPGSGYESTGQLPLYLLLAARYLAWTADFDSMYGEWPHVMRAVDRVIAEGATDDPIVQLALRELADAAASLGDQSARAHFINQQRRSPGVIETDATQLSAALDAAAVLGDRSSTRLATFRRCIEEASPYAWAALIHGVVGLEPDAPKNRVRIQPALPPEWTWFEVANIHLGDAALDLRYERSDERHTFRLRQSAGAVPVRAVFEPLLPIRTVHQILLDGQPAQLDIVKSGEGVITPIQLDLDYERVLEIAGG